jgi:hypothetical protein
MRLCLIGIAIALLAPAEIDVAHADCCDLEGCGSGDLDGKRPGSFEANPGSDPRNCIELVRLDSHIATACLPIFISAGPVP